MQSGILHGEEKDFKTAFSYFYEAFEGYDSVEHPFALDGLKYMLLCKIMLGAPDDVQSLLTGKMGLCIFFHFTFSNFLFYFIITVEQLESISLMI